MNERYQGIDLLRCIACLLVVLLHSCECFYIIKFLPGCSYMSLDVTALQTGDGLADTLDVPALISEVPWAILFEVITRCSVPIFVLITGFLLLPMKAEMSMGEFYRKRLLRVLIPLACWTLIYIFYCAFWVEKGLASPGDYLVYLLRSIGYMFVNFPTHVGHLWYVYMLVGLYLVIPILSPWVRQASRRQMRFVIALWFLTLLLPLLRLLTPQVLGEAAWNPFGTLYYFGGFIGYLLLGAYARKFLFASSRSFRRTAILLILSGIILAIIGLIIPLCQIDFGDSSSMMGLTTAYNLSLAFCSLPMCLEALGIFLLFFRWQPIHDEQQPRKYNLRIVHSFANRSYDIYLGHIIVLTLLCELLVIHLPFPSPVCIMILWLLTAILSYFLTYYRNINIYGNTRSTNI